MDKNKNNKHHIGLREVPQDELAPIEATKQTAPKKIPKITVMLIIGLLGLAVVLFGVFNWQSFTPGSISTLFQGSTGKGYPTNIIGSTVQSGNFSGVNGNAVMVSDSAFTMLSQSGETLVTSQHSFNTPMIKGDNTRFLVYNLGGTGYKTEEQSKTDFTGNATNNIMSGDIANNGRYALVTENDGYPSTLTVYLGDNSVQYTYDFSDYYVTDISLSSDGTKAAVCGIGAKGGASISAVYLFDFNNPDPISVVTYPNTTIEKVKYFGNGQVAAIGDNLTSLIKGTTGDKVDYNYNKLQLADSAVDNNRVALALMPYDNQTTSKLIVLDSNAKEISSIDVKGSIEGVSLFNNTVATLSGNTITGYSVGKGKAIGTADAGIDAKTIALSSENQAYVLGVTQIRQVALK